ncbi:MAG: hypothetical protein E3J72_11145 [Planctomycetota bacterium]|nr:MAG: hypothetical protein E3J72_11145 [Planctomycetota bacterium]
MCCKRLLLCALSILSLLTSVACSKICHYDDTKIGEVPVHGCRRYSLASSASFKLSKLPDYSGQTGVVVNGEFYLTNGWKYNFGNDAWIAIPKLEANVLVGAGDIIYCLFPYARTRSLFTNNLRAPQDYDNEQDYFRNEIWSFDTVTGVLDFLGTTPLAGEEIFNFARGGNLAFYDNATANLHLFSRTDSSGGRLHIYNTTGDTWQTDNCPVSGEVDFSSDSSTIFNNKVYFWGYDRFVNYDPAADAWGEITTVPPGLLNAARVILRSDENESALWAFDLDMYSASANEGNFNGYKITDVEGSFNIAHKMSLNNHFADLSPYYLDVKSDVVFLVYRQTFYKESQWGYKKTCGDSDVLLKFDVSTGQKIKFNLSPSPHASYFQTEYFDKLGCFFRGAVQVCYNGDLYYFGGFYIAGKVMKDC